jgi:hypothetical protein
LIIEKKNLKRERGRERKEKGYEEVHVKYFIEKVPPFAYPFPVYNMMGVLVLDFKCFT